MSGVEDTRRESLHAAYDGLVRWAVIVVTAGAVGAGCDVVFPPGKAPGAQPADGAVAADGRAADARLLDGEVPDARQTDAPPACSFTCFAADKSPGEPNPGNPGVAGCEFMPGDACPQYPWVETIDVCSCSTGQLPELFVVVGGNQANVAFFAPPGTNWSITVNDGTCLGGGGACPTDGPCQPGGEIFVWELVTILPASENKFELFEDVGSGCLQPAYTFSIAL
jgi:hypothetical protein